MNSRKQNRYEAKILILKSALYLSVLGVFILLLSIHTPYVLRLSRTAAVTAFSYAVLLPILLNVYHSLEIGRRDNIHIITTASLSILLTDIIVYFLLLIMNFNKNNRPGIIPIPGELLCLLIAFIIQFGLVLLFTRIATSLHWKYNPPRSSCLICLNEEDERFIRCCLAASSRRYRIDAVLYYHPDQPDSLDTLFNEVLHYNQVFLYNLPFEPRQRLVEFCYSLSKPISYSMEIADIIGYGAQHDMFEDASFISADNRRGLSIEQRFLKRMLDIIVSSLMLLLLSPIMLLCAAAIWLYDHEDVFFRQPRATIGGKVFSICKFRTMRTDAAHDRSVQTDDDRITPVGRILRRFRLDELPQLFNILKGDMSLVGPRPEMLSNVMSYTKEVPEFSYRLAVKAGLTGYAQIAGKYNTAPKEKMMMDLMYIEDYSIWHDIKLILQSATVFFRKDSTEAFENTEKKDNSHHTAA